MISKVSGWIWRRFYWREISTLSLQQAPAGFCKNFLFLPGSWVLVSVSLLESAEIGAKSEALPTGTSQRCDFQTSKVLNAMLWPQADQTHFVMFALSYTYLSSSDVTKHKNTASLNQVD